MKIFLDTANIKEIKEGISWGVVDGVTTNPSLVSRESGMSFDEIAKKILKMVKGPVSLECVSLKAEGMVKEGRSLAKMAPNVVVKIPICIEGLKATRVLSSEGVKVNATLIFNSLQALLAAKAGANYVSPFVGRLDDIGEDGMQVVRDIRQIFDNYDFKCKILAASIRHPMQVYEAAMAGADIATIPFSVLEKLVLHPKTDEGMKKFLEDWKKVKTR